MQFNSFIDGDPEDSRDLLEAKMKPLEEIFDEEKPADFPDEDSQVVKALLRRTLQYIPASPTCFSWPVTRWSATVTTTFNYMEPSYPGELSCRLLGRSPKPQSKN